MFGHQLNTTYSNMPKYRLIHEYLLIDKPSEDVADAIAISFGAFADDIAYGLSSLDKELFELKLTPIGKFKMLDSYATIIIGTSNREHSQTELELLISYKSDETSYHAYFQKRRIRWELNNFLSDFKKRCEKWL